MKSISTILVIVLLIIIIVGIVALSYTFFTSLFTTTTGAAQNTTIHQVEQLKTQVRIISMNINDVAVRNTGLNDLTELDVMVNGELADYALEPPVIEPNEVGIVKILDFIEEDDKIEMTTGLGTVSIEAPDPCEEAVLCLNFDDGIGKTAEDSSTYNNDGTFYGETFNDGTINGATRVDGKYGKGLKFDGDDDYINVNDDSSLNFGIGDFTLATWIKTTMDATTGYETIVGKVGPSPYDFYLLLLNSNERIRFGVNDGTNFTYIYGTTNVSDGKWHHVAAVRRTATGKLEIYVDGQLDGTPGADTFGDIDTSGGNLEIGRDRGIVNRYFDGIIDEVRIYSHSLTQEEIQTEMQSSMPIIRTVASYSFEETGQYVNDTHIWVKGKSGSALSFDGIDDYVNISDSSSLDISGGITIEFWTYKMGGLGSYNGTISKGNYQNAYSVIYKFDWMPEGPPYATYLRFYLENTTGETVNLKAYEGNLSGWMHYVFTYDGQKMRVYVNGNKTNEVEHTGPIRTNNQPLEIGRIYLSFYRYIKSTIDEIRIYKKAIY